MKHLIYILFVIAFFSHKVIAEGTTVSTSVTKSNSTGGNANTTVTTTTTTTTTQQDIDANIVKVAQDKLAQDSALIGTEIKVTSQNGVVLLDGNVTMQSQADEAMQVAKGIAGVKDVKSNIVVKTNPAQPRPLPSIYQKY